MNILKKCYCRIFQGVLNFASNFLPFREPKQLSSEQDVVSVLQKNNITSVLLVTGKNIHSLGLTKNLENSLEKNNIKVSVYETASNPTTQNVAEAEKTYIENNCNAIIGFGGGSPMDTAKATGARIAYPEKPLSKMKGLLKIKKKLPLLIAVPTTAGSGSETTVAAVITDSETHHKYAISSFPLIPKFAYLDPKLTLDLPANITATTGIDALTHAVEAYIGRSTTFKTRKAALQSIKLIFENLPEACRNGKNIIARENMLFASYKAGVAFTRSYVGYVHAIAHSLGGKYNIPHGLANAVILPYVLKSYGEKINKKLWKIGLFVGLFDKKTSIEDGADLVIEKIEELNEQLNIPSSITELQEKDIPELARTAAREANPVYPVPVLFSAKELETIYHQIKNN